MDQAYIRHTAESMIRNFGADALREAERVAKRYPKERDPGLNVWRAVAERIQALQPQSQG
jgi:hypothetical protein